MAIDLIFPKKKSLHAAKSAFAFQKKVLEDLKRDIEGKLRSEENVLVLPAYLTY